MTPKCLIAALIVLSLATTNSVHAAAYNCVEVELFQAGDQTGADSRQEKRAAEISPDVLETLRQGILSELPESLPDLKAVQVGDATCPDPSRAISFGGTVTDYKKGNKAARYLIGFGAGKQKFAVNAWLKDKATGQVIAEDEIVDRKFAGFFGGSAKKGVKDFAEKVTGFIRKTLKDIK